jgi:hypothetical protein
MICSTKILHLVVCLQRVFVNFYYLLFAGVLLVFFEKHKQNLSGLRDFLPHYPVQFITVFFCASRALCCGIPSFAGSVFADNRPPGKRSPRACQVSLLPFDVRPFICMYYFKLFSVFISRLEATNSRVSSIKLLPFARICTSSFSIETGSSFSA